MPALPPEQVSELLTDRRHALQADDDAYQLQQAATGSFPRIFTIESEYQSALRRAEIAFVDGLQRDIADGSFDGLAGWRRLHELKAAGAGDELMPTVLTEFFPDGTHVLAQSVTALSQACAGGSTCTLPTNSVSLPVAIGASVTSFYSSAANYGMGAGN